MYMMGNHIQSVPSTKKYLPDRSIQYKYVKGLSQTIVFHAFSALLCVTLSKYFNFSFKYKKTSTLRLCTY